ncbi:MAG: phosphatidylserine decarboxylase family protein [Candidatus Zixiibacteriota bacterium]
MIARDGWPFLLVALAATLLFALLAVWMTAWVFPVAAGGSGLLTLGLALFFRDPPRHTAAAAQSLLAPADGRIVALESVPDHPHIGGPTKRMSIFLSIFDVHINRSPSTATVDYVSYRPGKFLPAYRWKASDANERSEIGLTLPDGLRIVVRQIAGVMARRVVCRVSQGDRLTAGERIGMIRFGSRTDLLVPVDYQFCVRPGRHVKAGLTVVAQLPGNKPQPANERQRENAEL